MISFSEVEDVNGCRLDLYLWGKQFSWFVDMRKHPNETVIVRNVFQKTDRTLHTSEKSLYEFSETRSAGDMLKIKGHVTAVTFFTKKNEAILLPSKSHLTNVNVKDLLLRCCSSCFRELDCDKTSHFQQCIYCNHDKETLCLSKIFIKLNELASNSEKGVWVFSKETLHLFSELYEYLRSALLKDNDSDIVKLSKIFSCCVERLFNDQTIHEFNVEKVFVDDNSSLMVDELYQMRSYNYDLKT